MWDKLKNIEGKYHRLEEDLSNPDLVNDQDKYRKVVQAHSELTEVVEAIRRYRKLSTELDDAKEMAKGEGELAELAQSEVEELKEKVVTTEFDLKQLLIPRDPHDGKNVFVEIRAGTGGDEAGLFSADLFRMYNRFAETNRWKFHRIGWVQGDCVSNYRQRCLSLHEI
jgi:peptide chain release factor 1